VTAPDGTAYRLPYGKDSPDGAQRQAKEFLGEVFAGRVEPYDPRWAWLDEIEIVADA
jgi:hypothetical protein